MSHDVLHDVLYDRAESAKLKSRVFGYELRTIRTAFGFYFLGSVRFSNLWDSDFIPRFCTIFEFSKNFNFVLL